nr:MAG TPA: minor tail protein [Caudoviricetes sp.]
MAIFKVTAVPDFSQLRGEIARLQGSPVTLGVDTRQANVNIKATTKEIKNVGKAAKETSGFADLMGKSFSRLTLQMATWQMLGNAIAGVKRSFVEALDTMKSVDDEMVTIRKVTGASKDELEKIEKQAYKTASAYGVAADEYLQFVSGFSRAGYGEQASALAELAAKTQIVGDTNAETAQQFLLSVDAAYKYQGNIEKLTAVLDGANEIDNKYATSIQKVAEGLGKVAPIAAQAHVGVDELTAAIGTITAVTQRSGTEAATALRALFLNIIGDTKTEIDEGVTWTTGEIAGLRDVIKVYAKDAYDAAQATGSVINPMKAIAGLSQSMKDGLLTEQQLMEMVSDIGGKLRTSQLLALIQNWDMYESMLTDFAGAAGSADKEVENALDSWTRKTEILKNKWTEFVSHLVETDTIKGALDGVIKLVELLDSTGGHLIITVGLLTGAVLLLGHAKKELMASEAVKDIKAANAAIKELTTKVIAYAAAKKAAAAGDGEMALHAAELKEDLAGALGKLKAFGIGAAIFAALAAAIYVGTQKQREYNNALEETEEIQSKLGETQSEYDALINKTGELTSEEKKRLDVLKELREEQEKQLEAAKKAEWTAWNNLHGSGAKTMTGGMDANTGGMATGAVQMERMDVVALRNYREELEAIEAQYRAGEISAGAYYDALQDLNEAREDSVETIRAAIDAGYEVTDEQRQLVAAYDRVQQTLGVAQNATKQYVSKLVEEAQQSGATGKALYDLVAAQIAASNQGLNFSQQIAALQQLGYQAGLTAQQVAAATGSVGNSTQDVRNRERTIRALMENEGLTRAQAEARVYSNMQHALWTGISQNGGWGGSSYAPSGGGYSGGSGSSGSSRKNDLDNAKKKAAQATIDAIKKQRDAEIEAIDEKIDALKKQNEEEDRSKKLEELKLDILKKQDALLNARNERTVRQYNAATGQWEWVANPEKVKQAQEDLENAKKELREYEADVERETAIAELEARKKAIEAAYQLKIDGWQKLIDQLNGDVETEKALLAASLGDWDTYYQEMLKVYQGLLDAAEDYQKKLTAIQRQGGGKDDSSEKPSIGAAAVGAVSGAAKPPSNTKPSIGTAVVGAVSGAARPPIGKKQTTTTKPSGMGGGSRFNTNVIQKYDSGGILKGMGGIKATEQDEMILPPDITARMTRLSRTGNVQQLFRSMRSVLFGRGIPYGQSVAGTSSTDRHDVTTNNYTVNGVPISPQMAKMPVEEIIAELTGAAHQMRPFSNG